MRILQLLLIVAVVGTSIPFGLAQDASTFKTLYSFTGQPDGGDPAAGLVIGKNGVLYGTTKSGGTSNLGTVFQLKPPASPGGQWTEIVLHDFTGGSDGVNPTVPVVIGTGGVLYGTTYDGGTSNFGTVFSLTPPAFPGGAWKENVLWSFTGGTSDGANPNAVVAIGSGGVLYGTTQAGGSVPCNSPNTLAGCGVVFSLTPPTSPGGTWTETVLYNFTGGSDGANPNAGVVIGSGGVLYGTTHNGGTGVCYYAGTNFGCGMVFALRSPATPGGTWTERVLHSFTGGRVGNGDGANPDAGVVIGSGGVLYGTTYFGGTGGCGGGRALRITSALSTVPNEGGALGCGTVFNLAPSSSPGGAWTENVLWSFTGGTSDGANPSAGVVIGDGGVLYGTISATVFSLTPPTAPGGAWTETVLHTFTGGASPQAGLVIGKNGTLYGTTSSGGTSNAGTVFALKP